MAVQYSIQKMVSDGTLSTIVLGIQYLQRNDIYIRIAGEETPQSGAPSGYTWSFLDNTTLKILPVVPNGVEVVVYRRTDVDAMYNIYSQNAQFDEATIDENNQQLLYIAQEYLEQGIPGVGIESLVYVNTVGGINYYKFKLTDGAYTPVFGVPDGTDVLRVELAADNGASLVGFKHQGTGAVGRTLLDRGREYISVADYGAVGDGITDDTQAFKNALVAANGRSVFVPSGINNIYVVNNLDVPPTLLGSATNRPTLMCTLPNSAVFRSKASTPYPADSVHVRNIILDTSSAGCSAFYAEYSSGYSYMDSVYFENVETSQKFIASYVGNFIFGKWVRCADGKIGGAPTMVHQFIKAIQYGQVNDNLFDSCRIYHSGDGTNKIKPIEAYWANGNTFRKCNFEFCYGGIMKLTGGYSNTFNECWFEIGLFPSLPTATLPTELFELEYASSGAGTGSQPRAILLDKCIIAIGTPGAKFGLQDGGAIFKSSTGSGGGEWGLVNCTIWGDRPGAINLYSGPFPENRIVWNNVASAGGVDPAGSFADFYTAARITGQKSVTYVPEIYVIQTEARPTFNVQTGFCVVEEKTIKVHFDVGWTAMPNTGSYSLAITLPSSMRTPLADTWFIVDRYSGMSATINNYEIWGKIAAGTRFIQLFIKPAHSPDAVTALPPVHSTAGRLTGHVSFITP